MEKRPRTINVTQERYREALQKIANGCLDPVEVAREAIRSHRSERGAMDLTGVRFGRLEAIHYGGLREVGMRGGYVRREATWLCMCDCGRVLRVYAKSLFQGETKSCGCLQRDQNMRMIKHGRYVKKLMPAIMSCEELTDDVRGLQKAKRPGEAPVLDRPSDGAYSDRREHHGGP
jgi:hypothetical protein